MQQRECRTNQLPKHNQNMVCSMGNATWIGYRHITRTWYAAEGMPHKLVTKTRTWYAAVGMPHELVTDTTRTWYAAEEMPHKLVTKTKLEHGKQERECHMNRVPKHNQNMICSINKQNQSALEAPLPGYHNGSRRVQPIQLLPILGLGTMRLQS